MSRSHDLSRDDAMTDGMASGETAPGDMKAQPGGETTRGPEAAGDDRIPAKLLGAIISVGALAFIGILTETVMTVLFPQLMTEFSVGTATVQWITTIYLLAVAATMPLSGFLKRRFELRTIFVMAVALAIAGSLIMIVAQQFALLIVARIIQGIGSGIATPLMMNIILEQSPRSKIGRLMGFGSLVITVAPAIGPTVGGAVTSVLPWRAIYVIAVPLILIALAVGLHCIEQKSPIEDAFLDPLQVGSIIFALVGMVLGLNQAGVAVSSAVAGHPSPTATVVAVIAFVVGLGSLAGFVALTRHAFSPLLRLGILRNPVVALHLLPYLIMPLVSIGFGYVITNVAQLGLGTSAFLAGTLVLPGALVGAVCAPLGGWLYDRFGPARPILAVMGIATLGPVLLAVFAMDLNPTLLACFYFVFGFFFAMGFSNVMTSALSELPHEFTPDGNAIFNTSLQFGGAAGTALFSTLLSIAQAGHGSEGEPGFMHATLVGGQWVFVVMTVIMVVSWCALAAAFRLRATRGPVRGSAAR